MNTFLKVTLSVSAILILGIVILVFSFVQAMKPDKEREEKIIRAAAQYIQENLNEDFEVYDALYDNMGNFEFDYAAKARNRLNEVQFFIYHDPETNKLVDTYVAKKWAKDLENEIEAFVRKNFEEAIDIYLFFQEKTGKALGIDPLYAGSYKDYDVSPTIRFTFPRKKKAQNDELVNEFIAFLKNEAQLTHGTVIAGYVAENGEILSDEWTKEF